MHRIAQELHYLQISRLLEIERLQVKFLLDSLFLSASLFFHFFPFLFGCGLVLLLLTPNRRLQQLQRIEKAAKLIQEIVQVKHELLHISQIAKDPLQLLDDIRCDLVAVVNVADDGRVVLF